MAEVDARLRRLPDVLRPVAMRHAHEQFAGVYLVEQRMRRAALDRRADQGLWGAFDGPAIAVKSATALRDGQVNAEQDGILLRRVRS